MCIGLSERLDERPSHRRVTQTNDPFGSANHSPRPDAGRLYTCDTRHEELEMSLGGEPDKWHAEQSSEGRGAKAEADRALRASGYQPAWRRLWDRLFHRQRH